MKKGVRSQESSPKTTALPEGESARAELAVFDKPTHEEISVRAYFIFLAKGSLAGQCHDNWHQAERDWEQERRTPVWAQEGRLDKMPAAYSPPGMAHQTAAGSMSSNHVAGI